MSFVTLNNGKILGDGPTSYIVAEMNSSHGGNMETAKEMILAAKRAGCDGVKFSHGQRNPYIHSLITKKIEWRKSW